MWRFDETNSIKGMHVKLDFIYSGTDTSAPILFTLSGLTAKKFPYGTALRVKIKYACSGGDGIHVGDGGIDYIFVYRREIIKI